MRRRTDSTAARIHDLAALAHDLGPDELEVPVLLTDVASRETDRTAAVVRGASADLTDDERRRLRTEAVGGERLAGLILAALHPGTT
jgi:hypothetical protein